MHQDISTSRHSTSPIYIQLKHRLFVINLYSIYNIFQGCQQQNVYSQHLNPSHQTFNCNKTAVGSKVKPVSFAGSLCPWRQMWRLWPQVFKSPHLCRSKSGSVAPLCVCVCVCVCPSVRPSVRPGDTGSVQRDQAASWSPPKVVRPPYGPPLLPSETSAPPAEGSCIVKWRHARAVRPAGREEKSRQICKN